MQTIALTQTANGISLIKEFPNSAPVGTTISTTVSGLVFFFTVEHVHISLDHDLRVLCLHTETLAGSPEMGGMLQAKIGGPNHWAPPSSFPHSEATRHALITWREARAEKAKVAA